MDAGVPMAELVTRCRSGDERAADLLFARYAQRLTHVAEEHLSRKLAGRVEGLDVVQSVFRTFFRRTAQGEFRIDSSAQLWRLLVKITVIKARGQGRFHTAERRDPRLEQGVEWLPEAAAREPGPAEAAALVDEIEALLHGLPPLYCQVLELRLQGCHVSDVADQLGVSRQTVHRMLNLLQERLTRDAEA